MSEPLIVVDPPRGLSEISVDALWRWLGGLDEVTATAQRETVAHSRSKPIKRSSGNEPGRPVA